MTIARALRAIMISLAVLTTILWAVNFLWTLSLSAQYGGGALNGFMRDGHYYLSQHGSYTEVSQAIWERIRLHEIGLWLGAPLVVVCFGYLLFTVAFPAVMGLRKGPSVDERVEAVRASGERLAAKTCAGSIGGVGFGGPFILVEVFPAGLTVRVFLNRPIAILKEELRSITPLRWRRYVITYLSPDISSPIILNFVQHTDLAAILDQLAQDLPQTVHRGMPSAR
jgi:hypothetical protein